MNEQETNILVAEKLGWVLKHNNLHGCDMYQRGTDWRMPWMITWNGDGPYCGDGANGLPRYVLDIQAAWEIIEKLKKDFYFVNIDWVAQKFWVCNLFMYQDKEKPSVGAQADTAPMAVCLAFLKLP